MIMSHAYLSSGRNRPVQAITISSFMLDALMSSNSTDDEKSSVKGVTNTASVSSSKDGKESTTNDSKSALRFTPIQVVKRKKEIRHKSSSKRSNHSPIREFLEGTNDSKRSGFSSQKISRKNSENDKDFESTRRSDQEPCRSVCRFDSDSGFETHISREKYQSPSKSRYSDSRSHVLLRNTSLSASKSHGLSPKSDDDSDSDVNRSQNSSIYVTPEGTPFSMKSASEERYHSRFKRSLNDEHNEESYSANSSFNTSGYFTPESSPSKFNSAKRQKTRWSDSSSFCQERSSFSGWRSSLSLSSEQGIQPELIGYQMVGDSQFCRFGQQLLGLERVPMPSTAGRIGICVSGQTITDLHKRVRDNFYPISDKIILMIGTNDFLRNVDVSTMCQELSALIKTLQKSASNIILLTLPPIPKLEKKSISHFKLLDIYNSHIRSLENGDALRIADISPLYMTSHPQRCKMHLFELYFGGAAKRLDLIHLNRMGLEIIRKYILDKFL